MEFLHPQEFWSKDRIRHHQCLALHDIFERVQKSPFYAQRLKECGKTIDELATPEGIRNFPFTTKQDLRDNYPFGLACVPETEFSRMHCSSGTTGTPVAISYTKEDIETWAQIMARSMFITGMRKEDVFQNMSGYGLFTGGLGIHYGSEALGCLTIPAGAGNTRRQIKLIQDFNVSAIHILPSYAMHIAQHLKKENIETSLRIALVGAEPYTELTRKRIEDMLNVKVYNSFGLSEMNGPGVGMECIEQNGMHIWEDHYLFEIIDPETCENLPDGELGELVITTLSRKGMPVIRYRTRDLTRIITEDCSCGRKHRKIDRIQGRSDDMIILKGVNIYPMQIEKILMEFQEVGQNYLIHLEQEGLLENIRVQVEITPEHFEEDMRLLHKLRDQIARRIHDEILVTPKIELVAQHSIPQSEGKAQRVIDLRDK